MSQISQLHQQFCDYSLAFKGNTPKTINWLKETFKYFLNDTGISQIHTIDRVLIESYFLNGKMEKGWSNKTIKTRLSALSLFLEWCVQMSFINRNPAKEIPSPKLAKKIPEHLSKEKALILLDWTKNYRYAYKFERFRAIAMIATFIYTGIRLQELMSLKATDVQFENKLLFVRSGKGDKDRLIPLNDELTGHLKNYLKDRDRLKKNCPYFFTSMIHDQRISYIVIRRLVEKLRTACKIHFTPHLLRHTFAVSMLEGGCDIYALSKMMGHSDIKTTTLYLSATVGHLHSQIGKHVLLNN